MKNNLKKMAGYYKPYMGTFVLDMFFAFLASLISLVIPLVVRYITTNVTDMEADHYNLWNTCNTRADPVRSQLFHN